MLVAKETYFVVTTSEQLVVSKLLACFPPVVWTLYTDLNKFSLQVKILTTVNCLSWPPKMFVFCDLNIFKH